jgi:hypothetical protein
MMPARIRAAPNHLSTAAPPFIRPVIDDLEMLYSIDLLDYQKQKGTPIGDHIDRVGQVFLRDGIAM